MDEILDFMLDIEKEKKQHLENKDTDNEEYLEEILKINSDEIDLISNKESDKENNSIDSSQKESSSSEEKKRT